jgi:predicted phage terminase large subunit-like protein
MDAINDELLIRGHRQLMASSVKKFTQEMFYYQNKTPFIFGEHHLRICEALDKVIRGDTKKLIINIAPRYGKTELATKMFISYGFAVNPAARFIHLSYSGALTMDNSVSIKDIVNSECYKTIFPVRVRHGSDTKQWWDTVQGGGLYATSTLGQITGFGAGATDKEENEEESLDEFTALYNPHMFTGAIVIDDPLKPEDALSDLVRERVNRRFETTIRNRVNSRRTPIIIIMQRLHEHDLCGYLQEIEPDDWTVLSLPCLSIDEQGKEHALWEHKHTVEELHKIESANSFVFETQYMQNPTPLEGLMYSNIKTYDSLPLDNGIRKNYTDTADTGDDFLCSICYVEFTYGMYVTDVLYTKKPMEYTEIETAKLLTSNSVFIANIESNNGGRGFARNVERNIRNLGNKKTTIHTFTQSLNKQVRIFTHSAEVQNMIYFPSDWERRWADFARDIKSHRKEGRNAHDDAPDVLTGMVEFFGSGLSRISDDQIADDFS